jgi:hypothetical protein
MVLTTYDDLVDIIAPSFYEGEERLDALVPDLLASTEAEEDEHVSYIQTTLTKHSSSSNNGSILPSDH